MFLNLLDLLDKLPFFIHGNSLTPMIALLALHSSIEIICNHRWSAILLRAAQVLLVALAIAGTVFIFLPISKNLDFALSMTVLALYALFGLIHWRQKAAEVKRRGNPNEKAPGRKHASLILSLCDFFPSHRAILMQKKDFVRGDSPFKIEGAVEADSCSC